MSFFLVMTGAYSMAYDFDQEATHQKYDEITFLASSEPSLAFDGMSSITENFKLSTTPMYVIFSSATNQSENMTMTYYDSVLDNFIMKNLTIPNDDTFIIEMTPQNIGEETTMVLTGATGNIFYAYVFANDDTASDSTIFTPLIGGVVDLIEINISIWKIGYYLFIAGLILGSIGMLIMLAIKYYKWADEHKLFNRRNSRN